MIAGRLNQPKKRRRKKGKEKKKKKKKRFRADRICKRARNARRQQLKKEGEKESGRKNPE
jgi:hypothetical protein